MGELAFLFPGQGSQYVGMGRAFYDQFALVRRMFEEAADVTHKDLARLCFDGPAATLVQTDNVQPAITLVSLACLAVLREEGHAPSATAGHSLGEYAALCAAGVITFADAMRLVTVRGAAMNDAAQRHSGGMVAVFGLEMGALVAVCEAVREAGVVEVANQNSPGQIVLTGEKPGLQAAASLAKKRGAKLTVPLNVSGPWHSRFMAEAKERMRTELERCEFTAPTCPVVSNVTGDMHGGRADDIRDALVAQMVRPVLWAKCVRTLIAAGCRAVVEVGPGTVLTGMMRDISRDVKVFNVQDGGGLVKLRAEYSGLIA